MIKNQSTLVTLVLQGLRANHYNEYAALCYVVGAIEAAVHDERVGTTTDRLAAVADLLTALKIYRAEVAST
jgi:hypothetical protein